MDRLLNINDFDLLLKKTRLSKDLVDALFDGTLNHKQLSEKLSIKPNYLSNIINKIEFFDILFIRKIGKNVYYSLTLKGYEFHNYCNKKSQEVINAQESYLNNLKLAGDKK